MSSESSNESIVVYYLNDPTPWQSVRVRSIEDSEYGIGSQVVVKSSKTRMTGKFNKKRIIETFYDAIVMTLPFRMVFIWICHFFNIHDLIKTLLLGNSYKILLNFNFSLKQLFFY